MQHLYALIRVVDSSVATAAAPHLLASRRPCSLDSWQSLAPATLQHLECTARNFVYFSDYINWHWCRSSLRHPDRVALLPWLLRSELKDAMQAKDAERYRNHCFGIKK
jgi:hypothetical protein